MHNGSACRRGLWRTSSASTAQPPTLAPPRPLAEASRERFFIRARLYPSPSLGSRFCGARWEDCPADCMGCGLACGCVRLSRMSNVWDAQPPGWRALLCELHIGGPSPTPKVTEETGLWCSWSSCLEMDHGSAGTRLTRGARGHTESHAQLPPRALTPKSPFASDLRPPSPLHFSPSQRI